MIFNESYTLSNGVNIPKLGLGTWEIPDERVARAVCRAIKIGYRHIDTAQGYGNECGVGEGIEPIENYGDFSLFPVFGGKMQDDGTCVPRNFKGGSLS